MYIVDHLGNEAEYGRVKIERNYDDFSQVLPEWLELDNCSLTENADNNALLKRTNSSSNMKLQTRLFNFYNLSGIRLILGNMTSNGIEKIEIASEDGTTKVSVKKETNGRAGIYVNDTFVKYVSKKISFAVRTDQSDGKEARFFNKAQNLGIHFLPQSKSLNLMGYNTSMGEHFITGVFSINQKFRVSFEWNLPSITFSQAKLTLWKSY